jgi:predicted amidohydrolase
MKRVFICSPYRGNVEANRALALSLCRRATEQGCAPFAAHLLYPLFLDDAVPEERARGIACALAFLELCDEVWVADGDVSEGMRAEIEAARERGLRVRVVESRR